MSSHRHEDPSYSHFLTPLWLRTWLPGKKGLHFPDSLGAERGHVTQVRSMGRSGEQLPFLSPLPASWTKDTETNLPGTFVPKSVEPPHQPQTIYTGLPGGRGTHRSLDEEGVLGLCALRDRLGHFQTKATYKCLHLSELMKTGQIPVFPVSPLLAHAFPRPSSFRTVPSSSDPGD